MKKRIRGRIFVNVFHDELVVQIRNPQGEEFEYKLLDFSNLMVSGLFNTDEIAGDWIDVKYEVIEYKALEFFDVQQLDK